MVHSEKRVPSSARICGFWGKRAPKPRFSNFFYYVITIHTIGHVLIGHPDIRNESFRVRQPGTEVRFTLPGANKTLWPL